MRFLRPTKSAYHESQGRLLEEWRSATTMQIWPLPPARHAGCPEPRVQLIAVQTKHYDACAHRCAGRSLSAGATESI